MKFDRCKEQKIMAETWWQRLGVARYGQFRRKYKV
jgi:hypothetical protein